MKVDGPIPTPGLRSLLEFEAAKHGVAISYSVCDLGIHTTQNFVPQVEVIAHRGKKEVKFQLEHQGVKVNLIGDLLFPIEDKLIWVEHQPVAVVYGRYLYLAFDPEILLTSTHPDPTRLINSLIGQILDQAMPELVNAIRSYDFQDEAARYGEFRMNADEERTKQWNRDLRSNDYEIEQKASELRELYRKNAEIREWISMRQEYTQPHRRRTFEADFLALMKLVPAVNKVEFDENEVRVTTNEITIDYDGQDYEMGAYLITVNFRTLDLRIASVKRTDKDFPHPHVSTDGVPCLGNLSPGVQRLLADGDFAGLIQVILQFLGSYNRHNPYIKLEHWDPDFDDGEEERDRFERCYENSSSRDCVACGDGDCAYSYDAEENCFENSSIRDCISCGLSSCGHRREAIGLCREDHNCWECVACDNADCCYAGDEEECRESSDRQLCGECNQTDCQFFPEPEDDEDEDTDGEGEEKEDADEARS